MSNVLPDAFIALLVYGVIQLGKSLVPSSARWPNNLLRAIGYVLTYIMVVVNRFVMGPIHWPDLWGLLPLAAALYGGSALLYHVQDNATRTSNPQATERPTASPLAPQSAPRASAPGGTDESVNVSGPPPPERGP